MVQRIGVIGAGQMGLGIAHVAAMTGYDVILFDVSKDQLSVAEEKITANLSRQVKKSVLSEQDKELTLGRLVTNNKMDGLKNCDLVIEAVSENSEVKKSIFSELGKILKPEGLIASNTSSISITDLASTTGRPEKFMGMHFINPVPIMPLVELIPGIATDVSVYDIIRGVTIKMGKTPVKSKDYPGFIINRILMPMINEAVFTVYEGVANIEDVDAGMKLGTNQPMGPLQLADFIGLDTCLAIMKVLSNGFKDSKFRPCPLLEKYVEAGWLGRKTQKGFYDYGSEKPTANPY